MKTARLRVVALLLTCSALALGSATTVYAAAGGGKGAPAPDAEPLTGAAALKSTALPQAKGEAKVTPRGKPLNPDRSNERQPDQKLGRKGGADEVPMIKQVVMPAGPVGPQGDTYKSIGKLPDWSQRWDTKGPFRYGIRGHAKLPMKAPYDLKLAEVRARSDVDAEIDTTTNKCIPNGMPMIMTSTQGLLEIIFNPGRVTIDSENNELRRIHTDGRKQDPDPDPTFFGNSAGVWVNDVLYVHTLGQDSRNQVFYGFVGAGTGKMQIYEKMRLTDSDTLTIDTTIIDPDTFTAPFSYPTNYYRTKEEQKESMCIQNNRTSVGGGGVGFSLEPPPGLAPPPKLSR